MLKIPFLVLWREARRGKTIGRILANWVFQEWEGEVHGLVLDVACGQTPSYYRALGLTDNPKVRLVGVEYKQSLHPTVVADVTVPLPFKEKSTDAVIISAFLYIVPDPKVLLKEARRVLKQDGILMLTAPLVYPHIPEPTDYWRFTSDSLRLLLTQAGFADITIVPIGGHWTAAAYLLTPFLRPRWLVPPLAYWVCLKLDMWMENRFSLPHCPIGYVVKARGTA